MFVSYITYSIHFTQSHKIECLLISFSYSFQTEVRFHHPMRKNWSDVCHRLRDALSHWLSWCTFIPIIPDQKSRNPYNKTRFAIRVTKYVDLFLRGRCHVKPDEHLQWSSKTKDLLLTICFIKIYLESKQGKLCKLTQWAWWKSVFTRHQAEHNSHHEICFLVCGL